MGRRSTAPDCSRRGFLRGGFAGLGWLGAGGAASAARASGGGADSFGALLPADANGLALPPGFTSRVVAVSQQTVSGTSHAWHRDPDGGATFAAPDGGWVYVSNSERSSGAGGVGALRFDATGTVIDAYSILSGTTRNCAGGPTPWNTWLSCEETAGGRVYECDPFAPGSQGLVRPALGAFMHEAAAVDPVAQHVYLTEDVGNGLLYRFSPTLYPDLTSGTLEAAEVLDPQSQGAIAPGQVRPLAWHVVPDPEVLLGTPTRLQVPAATPFNGGEGAWYAAGEMAFTTKGDDRVWLVDTVGQTIEILYDRATSSDPELDDPDNVTITPCGDILVAEDAGNLQIVALTPTGDVKPIVRLDGVSGTEITGPALSPDGTRLYFSSQRNPGETFEVTGPFAPPPTVPALGILWRPLLAATLGAVGALALVRFGREKRGD